MEENLKLVGKGFNKLEKQIKNVRRFGVPVAVTSAAKMDTEAEGTTAAASPNMGPVITR